MAVTINGTTGITSPGLSVDSPTLVIDNVNNRVGIGTTITSSALHIYGGDNNNYADGIILHKIGGNLYGIYPSTNNLEFRSITANSHIATFSYGGNVGIGTTNPWDKLVVYGGGIHLGIAPNSGNSARFTYNTSNGNLDISAHSTGGNTYTRFLTSLSGVVQERLRITSTGNIGIGTTDPSSNKVVIVDTNNADALGLYRNYTGVGAAGTYLDIGCLSSTGTPVSGARILGYTDDARTSGGLSFYTRDSNTFYERITIQPGGQIGINTNVTGDARNGQGIFLKNSTGISWAATGSQANSRNWRLRNDDFGWGSLEFSKGSSNSTYGSSASDVVLSMTAGGEVGIGTNNPGRKLEIVGQHYSGVITTVLKISGNAWSLGGGNALEFGHDPANYPTWVTGRIASTYSGSNWGGGLKFFYNNGSTSATLTEGMELTRDGNLAFPSGKGIDFSATANSNGTSYGEVLTDYEEGTWTPSPQAASISIGRAWYHKIGRQVTVYASMSISNGSGGSFYLTSLPFVPDINTSTGLYNGIEGIGNCMVNVPSLPSGALQLTPYVWSSAIFFYWTISSGSWLQATGSQMGNSLIFVASYITAS